MADKRYLYVINPNSSENVTLGIEEAVRPLQDFGRRIICMGNSMGPKGIESQRRPMPPSHRP